MIFRQIDGYFSLTGEFFNCIGETFTTNLQHTQQIYNMLSWLTKSLEWSGWSNGSFDLTDPSYSHESNNVSGSQFTAVEERGV